jgi:hypothetical protein
MRPDRQIDALAGPNEFVRNLHARRPRTDHQYRALGQLAGITVGIGMDLHNSCIVGNALRHHRVLKRPGGGDNVVGLDHPCRGFDAEARSPGISPHFLHLDPAANRGLDHFRIGDKIVGDLFFGDEGIGVVSKRHAGKPVVPGRSISDQRVPSFRTPALSDAAAFKNEMRHLAFAQVFAHCHARLTGADDQRVYFFDRHSAPFFTALPAVV